MNFEHRGDFLVAAILLSLAVHVGIMFYARPRVMTHVVPQSAKTARRGPMNWVQTRPQEEKPVHFDVLPDVEPSKQEPEVEKSERPVGLSDQGTPDSESLKVPVPDVLQADSALEPSPDMKIDATPVQSEIARPNAGTAIPTIAMNVPSPAPSLAAPDVGAGVPRVGAPPPEIKPPEIEPLLPDLAVAAEASKSRIEPVAMPAPEFKPSTEVYEKVDEKVVEAEKAAVRDLLADDAPNELEKFVNVQMVTAGSGQWTYFKVMLTPRHDLPIVSKDFVVLIDASGSIGKDRMNSIRSAAKQILRSGTNSGDRFNLVAFRDKYTYAFKNWQPCDMMSFNRADAWLDNVAAHGRTDVFATISSVLTLPRDPRRPLIALVVTDGDANAGVSGTADILSKFTALNDGLISVYMYGVKSSANRELIDVLTRGNRGESFIYSGWRWGAGSGIEGLTERFRDPVLSDIRVIFASGVQVEAFPRRMRNLYRGGVLEFYGRVPAGTPEIAFSVRGLNGPDSHEGFFKLSFAVAASDGGVVSAWQEESAIDAKLGSR